MLRINRSCRTLMPPLAAQCIAGPRLPIRRPLNSLSSQPRQEGSQGSNQNNWRSRFKHGFSTKQKLRIGALVAGAAVFGGGCYKALKTEPQPKLMFRSHYVLANQLHDLCSSEKVNDILELRRQRNDPNFVKEVWCDLKDFSFDACVIKYLCNHKKAWVLNDYLSQIPKGRIDSLGLRAAYSALTFFIVSGNLPMVDVLVRHGIRPTHANGSLGAALWAVKSNYSHVIRYLVSNGYLDVNEPLTFKALTPTGKEVELKGSLADFVATFETKRRRYWQKILAELGGQVTKVYVWNDGKCIADRNLLSEAVGQNNKEEVAHLLHPGARPSSAQRSSSLGLTADPKKHLQEKRNLREALVMAVQKKNYRMAELLLEQGAGEPDFDLDLVRWPWLRNHEDPVRIAVEARDRKMTELLLLGGAPSDQRGYPIFTGPSSLQIALYQNDLRMVRLLQSYGSSIDSPSFCASSADRAIQEASKEMLKACLEESVALEGTDENKPSRFLDWVDILNEK